MAKIQELLDNLLHKKLGRDVRQSIHDSIEQCYKDATGHPESVAGVIEENKNMQKQLDSNINTINGRIDTILTGTVNTTKLVTVHSATIRNNSASDLTFKISSKDNETLKSIKDKSPTVINANVIAKALDGVAINGKGIPSSYNVESTNDEYVITVYSGSSSVVGQYVFMAVVTIAYEDIATDISSAELKDVRVGTDGTTYESAGEAVRQQIGSLKSDTSRIKKSLRTTYVDMNLFALGTINKDTGEEESSNKILRSIIDVNATEDITIKLPKGYQWNVAHWLAGKYRSDLWNENSWYQNLTIEKTTANYKYRILIRRSDGADITLSELIGVAETNREDLQSFDKIDDLKKKLNSYTEAAETSAQEAEQSKTAAETAAQQAAQSKTDIDNIKSDIEEVAKGENVTQIQQNMNDISSLKEKLSKIDTVNHISEIQMTSGKHKRMFFAKELVKTDSSGKATTNNIKDKIEALGGKWEYSATSVFGYAEEKGVMISASPDTLKSSDTYGTVTIRAYNADGSAHDDSGSYANTLVVLLIFTDEA